MPKSSQTKKCCKILPLIVHNTTIFISFMAHVPRSSCQAEWTFGYLSTPCRGRYKYGSPGVDIKHTAPQKWGSLQILVVLGRTSSILSDQSRLLLPLMSMVLYTRLPKLLFMLCTLLLSLMSKPLSLLRM